MGNTKHALLLALLTGPALGGLVGAIDAGTAAVAWAGLGQPGVRIHHLGDIPKYFAFMTFLGGIMGFVFGVWLLLLEYVSKRQLRIGRLDVLLAVVSACVLGRRWHLRVAQGCSSPVE